MIRAGCWLLGAAMALPTLAQPVAPLDRVQALISHDRLDSGYLPWDQAAFSYSRQWERRQLGSVTLTRARRFGAVDTQVEAAYAHPITPKLLLSTQLSVSPNSHFLASHSVGVGVQFEFMPAWLLHARLRSSEFPGGRVGQATLALERYFGNYSASLALHPVNALGTRAYGVEARGNYYYAADSYFGAIVSSGKEATSVGLDALEMADVRSIALVGRHRMGPGWSALYALSRTRQGRFYVRQGLSAGVQHDF